MASAANKFADSGFLIDIFLAGGQKALELLRDKTPGKIIITSETLEELRQFNRANIANLVTWAQNSANVTTISYVDSELAAARAALKAAEDAGATELSALRQAVDNAKKNAVERAYIE